MTPGGPIAQQLLRLMQGLGRAVSDGLGRLLIQATGSRGVGPDGPVRNTYRDEAALALALPAAMAAFDQFALSSMHDWRKVTSGVYAGGPQAGAAFAQFAAKRTMHVKLRPRTARARAAEGMRQQERNYDRCIEPVQYEYVTTFDFLPLASGTLARFTTKETIDPGGSASRDLRQYAVPGLPGGFGAVGAEALAVLRRAS